MCYTHTVSDTDRNTPTDIERALDAARETHPDLWDRTEAIARIIDPSAFLDGWRLSALRTPANIKSFETRLAYMRTIAMSKAQEVLYFLGVNTTADWETIMTRILDKDLKGALDDQETR